MLPELVAEAIVREGHHDLGAVAMPEGEGSVGNIDEQGGRRRVKGDTTKGTKGVDESFQQPSAPSEQSSDEPPAQPH